MTLTVIFTHDMNDHDQVCLLVTGKHTLSHTEHSQHTTSVFWFPLLSLLFYSSRPNTFKSTVHPLFLLFSTSLLPFHFHALSSPLTGGQVGPGPRWGIAMSFNKQLNSCTHATENDLHRHLRCKKCPIAEQTDTLSRLKTRKTTLCYNLSLCCLDLVCMMNGLF